MSEPDGHGSPASRAGSSGAGGPPAEALVSEVVDRMAHQIRNPLQAVAMNLEVIRVRTRKEAPDLWPELERFAEAVDENVALLDRRLELLVALGRRSDQEPEALHPGRFAAELVTALGFDADPPRVRVRDPEGGEQRTASVRPGRLAELLFRVLSTCRDAMEDAGAAELELGVEERNHATLLEILVPTGTGASGQDIPSAPVLEVRERRERWGEVAASAGGELDVEEIGGSLRLRIVLPAS